MALIATGCVTTDFLGRAETESLLGVDVGRQTQDGQAAGTCFLAELPAPAKAEQKAPVSVAVVVSDSRPTYENYAPLAFVFLVPYAHGEIPGIPPMTCIGAEDKCIDYRHVIGLLIARNLRASEAVLQARYEDAPGQLLQYDLRLDISLEDLHTDNIIISYGLGPFCGVPWILGLPMGRMGLEGKGAWELSETRSRKVLERGSFAVDARKTVGLYYSTTNSAYRPDGLMGQALSSVVAAITDGVVKTLRRERPAYWAGLANEREQQPAGPTP